MTYKYTDMIKMRFSISFLFVFVLTVCHAYSPVNVLKRFEYKLSFKGPHLMFKDGTIPFWEHSGNTIPSNDQIRLTPSLRSQKGRIWSKNTMPFSDWEIEVQLRVNGRGRVGADGMAIWYTKDVGVEGPVFGSNDQWTGMGVFLDSFDNDGLQNNPYIMLMTNDGTKLYDHQRDAITQQVGGCMRDFRNKPFPVRIKLEYYKKALTIYYHNGMNNDLSNYEICARVENIELPLNGHFGVSAATGGLADDHDVISFITHSLVDKNVQEQAVPASEEQQKYDHEYQEFLKKLEAEKENYNKEHPEKAQENIDDKKFFEVEGDRQFRMILDVQNTLQQSIRLLDSKLSEIQGKQESIVSLMSSNFNSLINAGSGRPNYQQPPPPPQQFNQNGQIQPEVLRRDEVNLLINQQSELVRTIRDINALVGDVSRKTAMLQQNQGQQAPPNMQDAGMLQQIHEGIKNFRFEMQGFANRNQPRCPEPPSCLNTVYFILFIAIQTLLFLGYFVYKNRSDSQMKKFY